MNEATAHTIELLFAITLIVIIGYMIKRRFFNGTRHTLPAVVHNLNQHRQQQPAGAPPAGAQAPAAHPAPDPHAAYAAHGSGVWHWIKGNYSLFLWILIIGLAGVGLVFFFPKDQNLSGFSSIFEVIGNITQYIFPGTLILIGLILLLWPDKTSSVEKKGH